MKTILVTGSNGQLGSELQELAKSSDYQFIFTDVAELDLSKAEAIEAIFNKYSFDVCINCAAYTAVDKAEDDEATAFMVNAQAVNHLSQQCSKHDVLFIHVSTDFIFSGNGNVPLKEDDIPLPINVYGETKLAGEKAAQNNWEKSVIIRTSWVYSTFGANFVKTMKRLMDERNELGVIYDQVGTPTYARDLAQLILKVVDEANDSNYGVYHYSNEGVVSWFDFAVAIKDLFELDCTIHPIPTEAYPTPAARPKYSVMSKQKVKDTFNISVPYWRDSLKECISKL